MHPFIRAFFGERSAKEMAQRELEDNQRALLSHQSSAVYHSKLVEYCKENIARLTQYVNKV